MRFFLALFSAACLSSSSTAFTPTGSGVFGVATRASALYGYLDDLTKDLYGPDANPDLEAESRETTKLDKEKVDRAGPGAWEQYVDFEEFDGGDGQMGVAGDGKKGLEKEWDGQATMAKSKMMSAKNAWGTTTGYADKLIEQGMDTQKAQRLENWHNQQEVLRQRKSHRYMTDEFDAVNSSTEEEDWRSLSKFGVERNQDFDLDEAFGPVVKGMELEDTIEIRTRINTVGIHEFNLKNSFMGFSDFRAAFTPDTPTGWTITPSEGSLNGKDGIDFIVRFKPSDPGVSEGYLVIDTEDAKWTWGLIGNTSM